MGKFKTNFITILSLILLLTISNSLIGQEKINSLKGRIYRDIGELKELKNYFGGRSTLISNRNRISETKFGFVQVNDTIARKYIIILEEVLYDQLNSEKQKYLILDTLTIKYNSEEEVILFN